MSIQDGAVPGEMGRLIDAFDWSTTPLGPRSAWPVSLRSTVQILLHSRHPMFLWWGPELVQFYNDAYRASLGPEKHPHALGQRGRDSWQEIWPIIAPQIEDVMLRGRPSWSVDALVPIIRNGRIEDVYWTYGYSPVFDDAGAIAGTLVVCTETTRQVLGLRRLRLVHAIGEALEDATSAAELAQRFTSAVAEFPEDIPFVAIYETSSGEPPRVKAGWNVDAECASFVAAALGSAPTGDSAVIDIADGRRGFALPLRMQSTGWAHVVFGLSERLPFDEAYEQLLTQLRGQLDAASARLVAANARAIAERERNDLLMHAPLAAAVMSGPEHTFVLANARYLEVVGRSSIVGQSYLEAFPELAATPLPGILDRVYETGAPYVTEEMVIPLDRNGSGLEDCWFRFNLEPVRDISGRIVGLLAIAVDITEQVRARRSLEDNQREREAMLVQLRNSSQAKDEFLAMLSHELRNPLSPIVTALELMKLDAGEFTRHLPVVERQVAHVVRLVDDLIDVSRFRRGQLDLVRERVEIRAIVERALETASPLLERGRHRVVVDVPAEGLPVHADPMRLTQVFANLLTNAAKYTPADGSVRICATRTGAHVVVSVTDDGVGIEAAALPQLFEPFVQIGQDSARSMGGLGLGLTIVKTLTEKHGGSVSAYSEGRGLGSTFNVRLPLAAELPARGAEAIPAVQASASVPKRILVVDDNEDAADMMVVLLERLGHVVRSAYDGPSALRLALEVPPDVAILDIGMPVMDGYELARRMKAAPELERTRLVALSGYGQPGDRARAREAGFVAHVVKPIAVDVLARVIAGHDA